MRKKLLVSMIALTLSLVGCSSVVNQKENDLIVYTANSEDVYEPIVSAFEEKTNINVYIITGGTGTLLSKIEGEKDNPIADVMWGGSIPNLQPKGEFFDTYISKNEENIYEDYKNKDGKITRFTVNPSVIIVNEDILNGIKVEGFEDLLNPSLKGKIIAANPSKSSSAYEQLINQLYAMGNGNPDDGWSYEEKLVDNIDITNSSSNVYKSVVNGDYAVGLTYEGPAIKCSRENKNIKVIYPKEGTIANADGVAILKNSRQRENAEKFIDYITSSEVQDMVEKNNNRRSVRKDTENSDIMKKLKEINIIHDDSEWVTNNKQAILEKFNDCIDK